MDLTKDINKTISCFFDKYGEKCISELATLASFHLYFFDMLSDNLKASNVYLDVQTIVSAHIDKSPIVKFDNNGNDICCEFGDLLFIANFRLKSKAVVIQAKQCCKSYSEGSSLKEQILYEKWPAFEIKKPTINSSRLVNYRNGKYKFTQKLDSLSRFITFFEGQKKMKVGNFASRDKTFAEFFVEFINEKNTKVGRSFLSQDRQEILARILNKFRTHFSYKRDDWGDFINTTLMWFSNRYFIHNKVKMGEKTKETRFDFLQLPNISTKEDLELKINSEDGLQDLSFFSIIKIKQL